jgi:hypothetical protein
MRSCPTGSDNRPTSGLLVVVHATRAARPTVHRHQRRFLVDPSSIKSINRAGCNLHSSNFKSTPWLMILWAELVVLSSPSFYKLWWFAPELPVM